MLCVVEKITTIKITFHKKSNAVQCICGFIGTSHECKEEIRGKVIFVHCSEENCNLCQVKIDRDECNELRWATDRDGYLVCGTCYNKLGADSETCDRIMLLQMNDVIVPCQKIKVYFLL